MLGLKLMHVSKMEYWCLFYQQRITAMRLKHGWIIISTWNYRMSLHIFSDNSAKTPWKLEHWWVIAFHMKLWMISIIHARMSVGEKPKRSIPYGLVDGKSYLFFKKKCIRFPDSKVHGASMGFIWGRQDPGGPHVGPMNFAIWDWFQGT